MKRDASSGRSEFSDFLLIPPAAALVALGMVLPEYWLILVAAAMLAMPILAIIQKVQRRADPRHADGRADQS